MRRFIIILSCFLCIQLLACCTKRDDQAVESNIPIKTDSMSLKITIGANTFNATLYSNETTAAFKTSLPLTITMNELNGNEKYFDLPYDLPANALDPGTIQTGDLMLYGSSTLVLFYKSFTTSYSYTRLARIDNPSDLAAVLGSGNVTVKFELE